MNIRLRLLAALALLGMGFALGHLSGGQPQSATSTASDTRSVFRALAARSTEQIPYDAVACEVNEPATSNQGTITYGQVSVGDFIAAYLSWSLQQTRTSTQDLSCIGKGVEQCAWLFGERKPTEGWSRILRFEYDPKSVSVDPKSLRCVDVP